jgi:hypothetical protein
MPEIETTASLATVDGDDIYLDPPVRLLAQYDGRWAQERIAGPRTGRMLDWRANGCNASTAAIILRWFAEDCTAEASRCLPSPIAPSTRAGTRCGWQRHSGPRPTQPGRWN